MVILDIDLGYGLMIWAMTVSIWSSRISIRDVLLLWSKNNDELKKRGFGNVCLMMWRALAPCLVTGYHSNTRSESLISNVCVVTWRV